MKSLFVLYFGSERVRVPLHYRIYCLFSLFVPWQICTRHAIALGPAHHVIGEAITVEFEALRTLAVASV